MRHHLRIAITLSLLVFGVVALSIAQTAPPNDADSRRIILSPSPAILIQIDGDPVYRDVEGTDLQRIVNTKYFIVREASGVFFLKVRYGWMESPLLEGDWTVAGAPPDPAVEASASNVPDIGERPDPDFGTGRATGPVPTIYVSTVPTELIVTAGPARFVPLPGSALEYVENTTAHVFRKPTNGELFVRTSGRWYRSWTSDGPWQLTATGDLPAGLASIPDAILEKNARSRP